MRLPATLAFAVLLAGCDGGEAGALAARPCPPRMAELSGVGACIDRYEADEDGMPARGTLPARRISFEDAESACRRVGYRLCTGREWSRACAGAGGDRTYPYAGRYVAGRCTTREPGEPGGNALPAAGGARAGCVSPEGVVDLSGNVWEWTDEADPTGTLRELRGGSFGVGGEDVACTAEDRTFQPMDAAFDGYGFRCCADARSR